MKEIEHPFLDFDEVTTMEMLQHLWDQGEDLDDVDTTALKKEHDSPWNHGNECIEAYFVIAQKAKDKL